MSVLALATKRCENENCGKTFVDRRSKYCSPECRVGKNSRIQSDRDRQRYQEEYAENKLQLQKIFDSKRTFLRQAWGSLKLPTKDFRRTKEWNSITKEAGDRSEEFAVNVLASLGFSSVKRIRFRNFPFDIVAEKDGRKALIEVTTNIYKRDQGRFQLARDLGIECYVFFAKPDLTTYYLMKPEKRHGRYTLNQQMVSDALQRIVVGVSLCE